MCVCIDLCYICTESRNVFHVNFVAYCHSYLLQLESGIFDMKMFIHSAKGAYWYYCHNETALQTVLDECVYERRYKMNE